MLKKMLRLETYSDRIQLLDTGLERQIFTELYAEVEGQPENGV